ncbi:MAG: hypothetical protein WC438_03255 [Candidatus Pacearchaeota archaeon]
MENRPIQSGRRYLLAFIIGTSIFLLGFALTYSISYIEFNRISGLQEETSYQIFKDKLYFSFFEQETCSLSSFEKISTDLRFQGKIIDDLEKKLGKNDARVLSKKRFYSLVELEHFEFVKQMNEKCNSNIPTILFFYSNKDEDIDKSENVGSFLDAMVSNNPKLIVYVFDINLDDDLVKELKTKYNVNSSPTLIINENTLLMNPRNIAEIEDFI